ncbi:hypothetical protein CDAR_195641 [Caerostris darwini]|uniref:Uncharacterized protein n=1 Tax=Caerostris darwini TaxID=1538125 RepID=A0AAV4Q7T1_9ARAC|nr:hypothetical protein CDAR_195641 [Caerostris darwini]
MQRTGERADNGRVKKKSQMHGSLLSFSTTERADIESTPSEPAYDSSKESHLQESLLSNPDSASSEERKMSGNVLCPRPILCKRYVLMKN